MIFRKYSNIRKIAWAYGILLICTAVLVQWPNARSDPATGLSRADYVPTPNGQSPLSKPLPDETLKVEDRGLVREVRVAGLWGSAHAKELAAQFVATVDQKLNDLQRYRLRREYLTSFIDGFMHPRTAFQNGCEEGYFRGQLYRREHPSRVKETMVAFGFFPVQMDGRFLFEFGSFGRFVSLDHGDECFVYQFFDGKEHKQFRVLNGSRVHAFGFLSPSSGPSRRMFYITKVL